jgi:ABC-type cobalamin transport system permease subunit
VNAPARDLALTACCLALGGYIWFETASYPRPSGESLVEGLGPAFYPRLLAILLAGLALLVAMASGLGRRREPPRAPGAAPPLGHLRVGILLAILVAYWLLMPLLGYLATTFAALVLTMFFLAPAERRRRPATLSLIAGCAAAATAGIFLLFTRVVKVPIPMGIWLGY